MRPLLRGGALTLALLLPWTAAAQELESESRAGALQNRAYSMSLELNAVLLGSLPLDPFYKGYYWGGGAVVHFSDYVGWQVARGGYSVNVSTSIRDQLERDFGSLPTMFDEVNWFVGSDLMLKPFYGKSSVLDTFVLHYEAYFLVGVSVFKFTQTGFAPAINLGGGLRLFHSKYLSTRLDITDNLVINSKFNFNQVIALQLILALNIGGGE